MKRIASYLIALATMAFTFTSCEDVPSPFGEIVKPSGEEKVVIDPAGSGTEKDPYNVAAVLEYVSGLVASEDSPKDVYVQGIVTNVTEAYGTQYGNATFDMSDDENGSNKFTFYRGLYFDNQKYTDASAPGVKVGDKVVICGRVMNYKGNTPETSQGKAWLVSINGKGGSGGGDTPSGNDIGSKDAPITCAKALELIKALADGAESDGKAFVKGKVIKVTTNQENFEKYGNLNYLISDDGSEANAITVYSGDGLNGEKFKGITDLAAGDEVIVYGKLYKYVNKSGQMTPEINKGNYLVSLVKGSGGGDTPTPSGGNMTKAVSGTAVTLTSSSVTGSDEVTVDFNAQGWADKADPTTVTLSNGTTIEFGAGENGTNSPVFYSATKGVRVYAKNTITVKGSKAIAKIVMNCDSYNGTDYIGNDMLYAKEEGKTVTICNDHTEAKGGTQLRIQTMVITFEGEGSGGGEQGGGQGVATLDVDFKANGQGDWTIANVKALPDGVSYIWSYDSKYGMKASAYVSGKRYESDNWLVSPALNLANGGTMTFKQALNYATSDYVKIMYTTTNGTGDVKSSEWKEASVDTWPAGSDWNFIESKATLPAGTVRVAFRYTSTTDKAATWEIESLSIK